MIDMDAAREESLDRIRAAILPTIQRDYPHLLEKAHAGERQALVSPETVLPEELESLIAGLVPLDWPEVLSGERPPPDWLCEPLVEAGRQSAIFSEAKAGKSLLILEMCCGIASGRAVLGNPARPPRPVVVCDMENGLTDIAERVTRLGYAPEELTGLHYYSFPSLDWLNTAKGGQQMSALAARHDAALVVVDTLSRVVDGDENDSETYHAFYRYTGLPLKARGIALVRLDHAGKDASRGMRGSSAKTSDVDAVWALMTEDNQLTLTRTHTRSAHGADRMVLTREEEPLRHEPLGGAPVSDPVVQWTATLDLLGVPQDAGRDRCREALKEAGYGVGTELLKRVVRARKGGSADVEVMLDEAEDRLTERDKPDLGPQVRSDSDDAPRPDLEGSGQVRSVSVKPQVRPDLLAQVRSRSGTPNGAKADLTYSLRHHRDAGEVSGQPPGQLERSVTDLYGGFRVVEGPETVQDGILRAAGLLDCQVDGQETEA